MLEDNEGILNQYQNFDDLIRKEKVFFLRKVHYRGFCTVWNLEMGLALGKTRAHVAGSITQDERSSFSYICLVLQSR